MTDLVIIAGIGLGVRRAGITAKDYLKEYGPGPGVPLSYSDYTGKLQNLRGQTCIDEMSAY